MKTKSGVIPICPVCHAEVVNDPEHVHGADEIATMDPWRE